MAIEVTGLAELAPVMYAAPVIAAEMERRAAALAGIVFKIVTIDPADGRITELTQQQGVNSIQSPQLLVAGARAAYATLQGVRFSDGAPGAEGAYEAPSWSADGRVMVFHRRSGTPSAGAGDRPAARITHGV